MRESTPIAFVVHAPIVRAGDVHDPAAARPHGQLKRRAAVAKASRKLGKRLQLREMLCGAGLAMQRDGMLDGRDCRKPHNQSRCEAADAT